MSVVRAKIKRLMWTYTAGVSQWASGRWVICCEEDGTFSLNRDRSKSVKSPMGYREVDTGFRFLQDAKDAANILEAAGYEDDDG